jgi:hypothetical protein
MPGLLTLPHLLAAFAMLLAAQGCYYYFYIENPNDFAYRFCSCGVSTSLSIRRSY